VATERIGSRYSLGFFVREGLWSRTRNSKHLPFSSSRPTAFPCPLARFAKHTRADTDSPSLGRLKPFPRFYILDEIPAALCPFITFANQMMSLDILRLDFIVVFYVGRTASVKRIRAKRSRLIGYHVEIRSLSCSRFLDRQLNDLFLFLLTITWEPDILFYCWIFRGSFPCETMRLVHAYLFTISLCALHASRMRGNTVQSPWMMNHGF